MPAQKPEECDLLIAEYINAILEEDDTDLLLMALGEGCRLVPMCRRGLAIE